MISDVRGYPEENQPHDLYGLSTDTKPITVPNGSVFVEMDTSKVYVFSEKDITWHEWGT